MGDCRTVPVEEFERDRSRGWEEGILGVIRECMR